MFVIDDDDAMHAVHPNTDGIFTVKSAPGQPLPKRVVRDMSDLPDSYRRTVIAGCLKLVPGADIHVLVRLRSRLEDQASSRVRA